MEKLTNEMLLKHWMENAATWAFLDFTGDQVADWISFMTPDGEYEPPDDVAASQSEMAGAYLALSQGYNFFAYQSFLDAGQALSASNPDDSGLADAVGKFDKRIETIRKYLGEMISENRERDEVFCRLFSNLNLSDEDIQ